MGCWVKRLQARWQAYRYRFVPWIALNLKDRKLRSVPKGSQDKIIPDSAVLSTLVEFFSALERGPANCNPLHSSPNRTDTSPQPSNKLQSYGSIRDVQNNRLGNITLDRTDEMYNSMHGSTIKNAFLESKLSQVYAIPHLQKRYIQENLSTPNVLSMPSCNTNVDTLSCHDMTFHPLMKKYKTASRHDDAVGQKIIMKRKYRTEATVPPVERYQHGLEVMLETLGFCTERKESSVVGVGRGVFVTRGTVPAKTVVSMYPGTMYYPFEPILFQSIANPFVFRCIDGVFIDGNDRSFSKMIYRSCAGRDRIGPYLTCDRSWLTPYPKNPLAVGQYVNNQSAGHPANVAYQEYNIQVDFPFPLRKYLPNIHYSPNLQTSQDASYRSLRVVVLVSLRDIEAGEELFSSYFTLVE
ncbi:SET domain-containing protein 9-like [Branchiostoma floridae]|uniref:SET domain-containing protein 9-like n=1 Tax=Branchiostoma floridae TaxID=7739 RepID=A0A9J7MEQ5_BRAFL|nr:SET domain-containing protein 9-like [Branchiostoma floridae]